MGRYLRVRLHRRWPGPSPKRVTPHKVGPVFRHSQYCERLTMLGSPQRVRIMFQILWIVSEGTRAVGILFFIQYVCNLYSRKSSFARQFFLTLGIRRTSEQLLMFKSDILFCCERVRFGQRRLSKTLVLPLNSRHFAKLNFFQQRLLYKSHAPTASICPHGHDTTLQLLMHIPMAHMLHLYTQNVKYPAVPCLS